MRRRSGFLRPLLEPQWSPWLFLTAAILLGIISNAAYDLIVQMLGTVAGAAIVGTLALTALVLFFWLYRSLGRREPGGGVVAPHRGLLALVSQGKLEDIPAFAALRHHMGQDGSTGCLSHCYLIAGEREKDPKKEPPASSWSNANGLRHICERAGRHCEIIEVVADDCRDGMRGCDEAWRRAREARLPRYEIIADVTGGTKQMSIGMCLSCVDSGCQMEYLYPRKKLPDGRADPSAGSEPRLISLHFFLRWPWDDQAG